MKVTIDESTYSALADVTDYIVDTKNITVGKTVLQLYYSGSLGRHFKVILKSPGKVLVHCKTSGQLSYLSQVDVQTEWFKDRANGPFEIFVLGNKHIISNKLTEEYEGLSGKVNEAMTALASVTFNNFPTEDTFKNWSNVFPDFDIGFWKKVLDDNDPLLANVVAVKTGVENLSPWIKLAKFVNEDGFEEKFTAFLSQYGNVVLAE